MSKKGKARATATARATSGDDQTREGPALEPLLRRVAETPVDFRDEPRCGATGRVHVAAVVGDLLDRLGLPAEADALAELAPEGKQAAAERNRLSVALLQAWLLADPSLAAAGLGATEVMALLGAGAAELAAHTAAARFVDHAERREELVRHALARLGMHPAGETQAQAQDRLTSLSAAERARVMAASKEAEARARKIREQLAAKAAKEAADKWTRE
ncbi:MAG TPA: hypothetical protein VMZ28_07515 [Kofleriaceae bacterium]|nr:hypothetical protein [Kofleriaceae bacterium]